MFEETEQVSVIFSNELLEDDINLEFILYGYLEQERWLVLGATTKKIVRKLKGNIYVKRDDNQIKIIKRLFRI